MGRTVFGEVEEVEARGVIAVGQEITLKNNDGTLTEGVLGVIIQDFNGNVLKLAFPQQDIPKQYWNDFLRILNDRLHYTFVLYKDGLTDSTMGALKEVIQEVVLKFVNRENVNGAEGQ